MDEPIIELARLAAAALLGGATLVQISPIQFNPWSWLARKIGRAINGEVIERVDELEGVVKSIRATNDERDAKATRIRILRFGDEILHGIEHSKEHFDQILLDITEYEHYCRDHPEFKNNMTELTTQKIMSTYSELWEEHGFL